MQIYPVATASPSAVAATQSSVRPPTFVATTHSTTTTSQTNVDSTLSLTSRPEYVEEIITISVLVRRAIWCTILFLAVSNAALLGVLALVYSQNETNDSLLWLFRIYFLFSNGNAFLMQHSTSVAIGYAVLCGVFSLVALRLVWLSVTTPRLRVDLIRRLGRGGGTSWGMPRSISPWQWIKMAHSRWHRTAGIRGPYFEIRLLCEEMFEIAFQTAAALSASQSISNVPLNLIYAVVICLNSIASTVYRRVFKTSLVKQRIACLLTDIVLDFVWGTLLPIWMYLPIVRIYLDRANILEYLDSFANSTREIERVLVISWRLYLFSVIPFCNSLLNLLEIQTILREISPQVSEITTTRSTRTDHQHVVDTHKTQPLLRKYHVGRVRPGWLVQIVQVLLPLYGVSVLLMTLTVNGVFHEVPHSDQYTCIHRVYPWLSTKEACLGRQINCTALSIQGSTEELERAMDLFDKSSLADLFLLSCPALEIPSTIQSFHRLMTIVVKDSTLVEWKETAMIRDEFYEELRTVQLKDVRILQDPVGLTGVGGPIASSVEWIHLENLDGARILSLVGDHWKGLLFFDCMNCGLPIIPEALYLMPRLTMVAMPNNNFRTIPDDWIPRSQLQLQMLWLDANAELTELPDSLWRQAATCGIFSMSWTNLSVVPVWLAEIAGPDFQLTAIDTPVRATAGTPPQVQRLVMCS